MTNFSDVEIRIITSADTAAVVRLYKSAGWWEDHYVAEAFIPGMVKHSTCFAGAFAGRNCPAGDAPQQQGQQ